LRSNSRRRHDSSRNRWLLVSVSDSLKCSREGITLMRLVLSQLCSRFICCWRQLKAVSRVDIMLRVHGGVGFENVDVYITIYRRVCIGEEKSRGPLTTNDCTTDGLDGVAIGVPLGMTSNRRSLDDSRPVEEGQRRWRGGTMGRC